MRRAEPAATPTGLSMVTKGGCSGSSEMSRMPNLAEVDSRVSTIRRSRGIIAILSACFSFYICSFLVNVLLLISILMIAVTVPKVPRRQITKCRAGAAVYVRLRSKYNTVTVNSAPRLLYRTVRYARRRRSTYFTTNVRARRPGRTSAMWAWGGGPHMNERTRATHGATQINVAESRYGGGLGGARPLPHAELLRRREGGRGGRRIAIYGLGGACVHMARWERTPGPMGANP